MEASTPSTNEESAQSSLSDKQSTDRKKTGSHTSEAFALKEFLPAFEQPRAYKNSSLFIETNSMCEFAMRNGLEVPPSLIQKREILNAKIDQGFDIDDVGTLSTVHQQLTKIIAPATPQVLLLIDSEKSKASPFGFISLIPIVRQIILVSLIFLVSIVAIGQLEIINEENLSAGILGSHGLTAIALLGYLVSCAGLGACFTCLYRLREYISNLTFDPRYNSAYWTSILLGAIAGLFISNYCTPSFSQRVQRLVPIRRQFLVNLHWRYWQAFLPIWFTRFYNASLIQLNRYLKET